MSLLSLACGPYFDTDSAGFWVSITVFVVFKPLAYFGFIQTFRYRVSQAIPMTYRRAAWGGGGQVYAAGGSAAGSFRA